MTWATEADLVAEFVAWAEPQGWTAYAETAGWDLLLVRIEDGFQIGIEAKLSLNAKVLCQVIEHDRWSDRGGPDCHAVLVPAPKTVGGLATIAASLGVVVIHALGPAPKNVRRSPFSPALPKLKDTLWHWHEDWPERAPDKRCKLPDYVPDVSGGHSAPVKLTEWKIAALKAVIIMEVRGFITRAEFTALRLSPSRWTQYWLKSNGSGGWIPTTATPDFKAQHPVNYEQIKADFAKWDPAAQPAKAVA